jgi:hypothetical protein
MMFIDLLGDDVAQLQDRNTWNTGSELNIFPMNNERWIKKNNQVKKVEQQMNKDE